jgi:hypothetical protein
MPFADNTTMTRLISTISILAVMLTLLHCTQSSEINPPTIKLIDTLDGLYRKTGQVINGKREGIFNSYYKEAEISETEIFRNDSIYIRFYYHKGIPVTKGFYKNDSLLYSTIENYDSYLSYINLDQTVYNYGGSFAGQGKEIFRKSCYSCHHETKEGTDFYKNTNYNDDLINKAFQSIKLDSIDHKIQLYPLDTVRHFMFAFLSKQDRESLIKFFHSKENLTVFVN